MYPKRQRKSYGSTTTILSAQTRLRLILKQAETRLHVLDSLHQKIVLSSCRYMTIGERTEVIGVLENMRARLGRIYVKYLLVNDQVRYSKTASTTSLSSGDPTVSPSKGPSTTQCYSTMRSSRKHSKASASSDQSTPTTDLGSKSDNTHEPSSETSSPYGAEYFPARKRP